MQPTAGGCASIAVLRTIRAAPTLVRLTAKKVFGMTLDPIAFQLRGRLLKKCVVRLGRGAADILQILRLMGWAHAETKILRGTKPPALD